MTRQIVVARCGRTGRTACGILEHRPITVQPSAPTDTKLDYLAAHVRMVDPLYEELACWTPPCAPASTDASIAGR